MNYKNLNKFILICLIIIITFIFFNKFLKRNINENYQGINTNSFFEELERRKIKYDKDNKIIYINGKDIQFKQHFNTNEAVINAKNKITTSQILSKNNIPIPKFVEIDLSLNVNEIIDKIEKNNIKYPIVMKPINGTFGKDVYTDIDTKNEIEITIKELKKYGKVVVEEQIDGDCYRIFVFNGKVLDIIKREKPYIIGDGYHTIKELIEERNQENLKMNLLQINNISNILIKKQGYSFESVPPVGKKIIISNVINMHNGARISRIPISNVPKENIELFIKVNKVMNIMCSGIDYLSNDITVPYYKNNSKILEVNGTPDTEIHFKIKGLNIFEKIIDTFI
jgi:cyanophycin synthetase